MEGLIIKVIDEILKNKQVNRGLSIMKESKFEQMHDAYRIKEFISLQMYFYGGTGSLFISWFGQIYLIILSNIRVCFAKFAHVRY